jgi:hypothetical protein
MSKNLVEKYISDFKKIKGKNKSLSFDEVNEIVNKLDLIKDKPKLIKEELLLDVLVDKSKKNKVISKLIKLLQGKIFVSYPLVKEKIDSSKDQYLISRLKTTKIKRVNQTLDKSIKSIVIISLLREYMKRTIDDNLINLLKWAHDHGIEEPIKQECTKFLEKIQPVY